MQKETTIHNLGATGLKATITLHRGGQERPAVGNNVIVCATLILPGTANGYRILLPPDLQFGSNVYISGENLHECWGCPVEGNLKRSENFTAPTWTEAFSKARTHTLAELGKLQAALAIREKALADAETAPVAVAVPEAPTTHCCRQHGPDGKFLPALPLLAIP